MEVYPGLTILTTNWKEDIDPAFWHCICCIGRFWLPDTRQHAPSAKKHPEGLHPKRLINPPDDRYEQEADRVADQVMRRKDLNLNHVVSWKHASDTTSAGCGCIPAILQFTQLRRSMLSCFPVLRHIDRCLLKWVKWKYKKKGQYTKRARHWLGQVARYQPGLFAHWCLGAPFPAE